MGCEGVPLSSQVRALDTKQRVEPSHLCCAWCSARSSPARRGLQDGLYDGAEAVGATASSLPRRRCCCVYRSSSFLRSSINALPLHSALRPPCGTPSADP